MLFQHELHRLEPPFMLSPRCSHLIQARRLSLNRLSAAPYASCADYADIGSQSKPHIQIGARLSCYQRLTLLLSQTFFVTRAFSHQSLGFPPQHDACTYSTRRLAESLIKDNLDPRQPVSHNPISCDVSSNTCN